jgi:hypothetical protein
MTAQPWTNCDRDREAWRRAKAALPHGTLRELVALAQTIKAELCRSCEPKSNLNSEASHENLISPTTSKPAQKAPAKESRQRNNLGHANSGTPESPINQKSRSVSHGR